MSMPSILCERLSINPIDLTEPLRHIIKYRYSESAKYLAGEKAYIAWAWKRPLYPFQNSPKMQVVYSFGKTREWAVYAVNERMIPSK